MPGKAFLYSPAGSAHVTADASKGLRSFIPLGTERLIVFLKRLRGFPSLLSVGNQGPCCCKARAFPAFSCDLSASKTPRPKGTAHCHPKPPVKSTTFSLREYAVSMGCNKLFSLSTKLWRIMLGEIKQ